MKVAIVALLNGSFDPYWRDVEIGAKAALSNFRCDLEYLTPENATAERDITLWQLRMIERLVIEKDVAAVAVAMLNYSKAGGAIKRLCDAGIPVVTFDTDAPDSGRAFFIGTNNQVAGQMCGYHLAKMMNFEGKVVIDTPSLDVYSCIARMAGFREVMARYNNIQIVKTVCGEENHAKMIAEAQTTVRQIPDLRAIFCTSGTCAKVNAEAVAQAGKTGKIHIASVDADAELIKCVKRGDISMTIAQRPYTMGFRVMSYLYEIGQRGIESVLKGVPENRIIDTGIQKLTKDNIDSYEESLKRQGLPVEFD
jgi:ribose transport system substrate-binding protein